jgi:hypothetical protein
MATRFIPRMTLLAMLLIIVSLPAFAQQSQPYPTDLQKKFLRDDVPAVKPDKPLIPRAVAREKRKEGFFRPYGLATWLSTGGCLLTGAGDITSQLNAEKRGYTEANPILRNDQGRLNVGRAVLFKAAACLLPLIGDKRWPVQMTVFRTVVTGGQAFAWIRNSR